MATQEQTPEQKKRAVLKAKVWEIFVKRMQMINTYIPPDKDFKDKQVVLDQMIEATALGALAAARKFDKIIPDQIKKLIPDKV